MSGLPNIDLQSIVTGLTGHASSAGLIGALGAAIATQAITNAAVTALNSQGVKSQLDPLGLTKLLPGASSAPAAAVPAAPAAPVAAAPAPAAAPAKTITASGFALLPASVQATLMAAGYSIV